MSIKEAHAAVEKAFGGKPIDPSRLNAQTGHAPDALEAKSKAKAAPQVEASEDEEAQGAELQGEEGSEATENVETETEVKAKAETEESDEDVIDLDKKNAKFKIKGKTLTAEELKKSFLRYEDYTKKTQAVAQLRKQAEQFQTFADNFKHDLPKLLQNPDLESQFLEVYPEQFHALYNSLKAITGQIRKPDAEDGEERQQSAESKVDPKILKVLEDIARRVEKVESKTQADETKTAEAQLEVVFSKMQSKYDMGKPELNTVLEELVLAKAEQSTKETFTMADWDKLFKTEFQRLGGIKASAGKELFDSQKKANQKGKDVPSGGGIPSGAPLKPKNLKEASAAFETHLRKQGHR